MTDDKWKTLQGLKDELFQTRDKDAFDQVVNKIRLLRKGERHDRAAEAKAA